MPNITGSNGNLQGLSHVLLLTRWAVSRTTTGGTSTRADFLLRKASPVQRPATSQGRAVLIVVLCRSVNSKPAARTAANIAQAQSRAVSPSFETDEPMNKS